MRIALTGATGLLGSNLVLEILKNNYKNLSELEIIFFGRGSKEKSFSQRILETIKEDVLDYIDDPQLQFSTIADWIKEKTFYVDFDFSNPNVKVDDEAMKMLKSKKIDFFFHVAALTDFRNSEDVIKMLDLINVKGTENILKLVSEIDLGKFIYVSSAYVCGITSGVVNPDYYSDDVVFRNYYEKTKLESEKMVRKFCKERNLGLKVLRPSTIGGRLYEKPIGKINKIDVFYEWCLFFYNYKQKTLGLKNCIDIPFHIDLRFCYNKNSGLNIVPVDFAAKVAYFLVFKNESFDYDESFHLVCEEETSHEEYTTIMLSKLNISGVVHVNEIPENKNKFEKLYYRTVGKIYTPYIKQDKIKFSTSNIEKLTDLNISCKQITKKNFSDLIEYVKSKNFEI